MNPATISTLLGQVRGHPANFAVGARVCQEGAVGRMQRQRKA